MKVTLIHSIKPTHYLMHYFPSIYAGVYDAWKQLPRGVASLIEYVSIDVGKDENNEPDRVLIEIKIAGCHHITTNNHKWARTGGFFFTYFYQSPSKETVQKDICVDTKKEVLKLLKEYAEAFEETSTEISNLLK